MTAQVDDEDGATETVWFFSSRQTEFVRQLGDGRRAVAHFAAKDHELFASLDGTLVPFNDRATIDRLWNPSSRPGTRAARTTRTCNCCA